MRFKIITAALLLGIMAGFSANVMAQVGVPHSKRGTGSLCDYDSRTRYYSWNSVFCSPYGGNMEFIEFCYEDSLSRGYVIDKDYTDAGGYVTASAAACGRLEGLKFFLDKGFYLDEVNRDSMKTPLQAAAEQGRYEVCKYLLEKGASPLKKSYAIHEDAYYYAKQSGVHSVIKLVGDAWRKWQGLAEARREQYKKEIQNLNLNDYEKFKLKHNLGNFKAEMFFS